MDKINLNIDFAAICRLCLQKEPILHFIFRTETFHLNHDISLSIKQLIDAEISESDDLPRNVCESCFLTLYRFEEFRNRCRQSAANLKFLITVKYLEIKKEEPGDVTENSPSVGSEEEKLNIDESSGSCKVLSKPTVLDNKVGYETLEKKCQAIGSSTPNNPLNDSNCNGAKESKTIPRQRGEKKICPICGVLVYHLKTHLQVHNMVKQFSCDMCDKTFTLRGNLLKHKKTIHSSVRSYPCNNCNMRFKTANALERHVRIHTGERKYKCTLCDKSFLSRHNFKDHNLTHTQNRKYECEFCHTKFLNSQGLRRHLPKHTGEKPYQCGICTMRFSYSTQATQHRRIHMKSNAFVCTFCSLEFHDMRMFRMHHTVDHEVHLPLISNGRTGSTDEDEGD